MSSFARASRPVFSSASAAFQARQAFRQTYRRQEWSRRWQSTSADAGAQPSWFKRMWDSPIGLKTVHFWAPVMKVRLSPLALPFTKSRKTKKKKLTRVSVQWALVLAGVSDFARPAEKLSLTQNGALTATGFIWTRWCLIIKPKNYLLAAVNFFLGLVGVVQVSRIMMYNASQKDKDPLETAADAVKDVKSS